MAVAAAAVSGGDGGIRWCCAEKSEEGVDTGRVSEGPGGLRGSVGGVQGVGELAERQEVAERVLARCGHTPLILLARGGR